MKEKRIKICIIETELFPYYDTRLHKYCKGKKIYMIDESKMKWIDKTEKESDKVQEYLKSLVEKREETND